MLATAGARVPGLGRRPGRAARRPRRAGCVGAYPAAVASAERAAAELADPAAARLVLARARQRAGDLAGAEDLLVALAAERGGDADVAGALARLWVAAGRYRDALAVVAAAEPLPATAGGALLRGRGSASNFVLVQRLAPLIGDGQGAAGVLLDEQDGQAGLIAQGPDQVHDLGDDPGREAQ